MFGAPNNQVLAPGTYMGAKSIFDTTRTVSDPGLTIYGDGRASVGFGQFTVQQINFDATSHVTNFAASFEYHSSPSTALSGSVDYNYVPPGAGILLNDSDAEGDPLTDGGVRRQLPGTLTSAWRRGRQSPGANLLRRPKP